MRPTIIAGNWKMYKTLPETEELLRALLETLGTLPPDIQVIVAPPFTSLALAGSILKDSPLKLAAQNMSEFDEGAHTGEISWKMIQSCGCHYVILGHSERRQHYGETDALINRKTKKALDSGLRPIVCVGETLDHRESGTTTSVVREQVKRALDGITGEQMMRVIIAYEPVWAIGTGKNATPAQAQEVHLMIRLLLRDMFGPAVSTATVLQYGGSVKPDNSADLLGQEDIDGALVGGACLKAESFTAIVKSAK